MTVYNVVFHADTEGDYNEAYQWYEDQKTGLGDDFLSVINSRIKQIQNNPEIFGAKYKTGYHEAMVKKFPYAIVYRIYKKQRIVFITSIHHQKSNPGEEI